jgi:Fe-S cluster assembly protein SufD
MVTTLAPQANDKLSKAGVFTKELAQKISTSHQEPQWLNEQRLTAYTVFDETPLPTISDEPWRRTSLKRVKWNSFTPLSQPSIQPAANLSDLPEFLREKLDEERETSGRMLFVNGQLIYHEVDPSLAEKGVIFTDMQTATKEHADLVQAHFGTSVPASDSKFAALNAAFWQNGTFLYVPKDVNFDHHHPFKTVILLDGENAVSVHRTLIIGQQSANLDYIEETASLNNNEAGLCVGVVEMITGPNAETRYVDLQNLGTKVVNFNTKRALVQNDGNAIWEVGAFGSQLTKTFIDSQLIGDGANTDCNGVYFLDGNQHVDIDTLMQHTGYATTGDLLIHGALKDKARSVFIGMIKIDPSGQLTNSYLKNQNLLLDPTARADSIPQLEIDANDVRASHAATISKIEAEYLFYLMSRGIPYDGAIELIVNGFFTTIFDRMANERVREKMMAAVVKKMAA